MSLSKIKWTNKFQWLDLFHKKEDSPFSVMSALQSNQLFMKLTPQELKLVARLVHVRHYETGELVFAQYEKGLGMYIIAKGSVEVKMQNPEQPESDLSVTVLHEGSFLGELALIDKDNKRTASAFAQSPCVLIGFFKPDLIEIMERKPSTGVKILFQLARILGKRLTETTEAIGVLSRQLDHFQKENLEDWKKTHDLKKSFK